MQYKINGLILDTEQRTLSTGDDTKTIRPRTLQLLLYFISQKDAVISKQELLDSVWSDVVVDEGVIFISISEIRKLFGDSKIILSHPRKGYQLIGEVIAVNEPITAKLSVPKITLASVMFTVCVVLIAFWALNRPPENDIRPNNVTQEKRILVLPIHNAINFEDRRWLKLGGMDHIISVLKESSSSEYFYDTEETIILINAAKFSASSNSQDIQRLFRLSGATHIIDTQFIGKNLEYTIALTMMSPNNIHRKALFAESIDHGLVLTAQEILRQFSTSVTDVSVELKREFKNELFAEAMLAYETDWESAISFFESYLNIDPDSTIAMLYLTRLYIWQNYPMKASELANKLSDNEGLSHEDRARVMYYKGQIAHRAGQTERAIDNFMQSVAILPGKRNSLLMARINSSLGEVHFDTGRYEQAFQYFSQALAFYESTQKTIDVLSTQLKLAKTYKMQKQLTLAEDVFRQAKRGIQENDVAFLFDELKRTEALLR